MAKSIARSLTRLVLYSFRYLTHLTSSKKAQTEAFRRAKHKSDSSIVVKLQIINCHELTLVSYEFDT